MTLQLTVFGIYAVKWPKFRIWGSFRGTAPKWEKTSPGPICTIMQNCTLIGATVAEIPVTGQKKKQQI